MKPPPIQWPEALRQHLTLAEIDEHDRLLRKRAWRLRLSDDEQSRLAYLSGRRLPPPEQEQEGAA